MVNQPCSYPGCTYETGEIADINLLIEVLKIHAVSHSAAGQGGGAARQKAPKIERPKISSGSSEETWNSFLARWSMFKRGTTLTADETAQQLFQCCDEHLGNAILRTDPDITQRDEATLLAVIKALAVIPVARVVRRTDLLAMKQDHGEATRNYLARIKGKALTCAYKKRCGRAATADNAPCTAEVDFTDIIVKDVLIAGLVDDEIRKDVLGWTEVDNKTVEETVSFVEAKEMARDALSKPAPLGSNAMSSYKADKKKPPPEPKKKTRCSDCSTEMDKMVWNQRQRRFIEHSLCISCWKKAAEKKNKPKDNKSGNAGADETSALLIGGIESPPRTETPESDTPAAVWRKYTLYGINTPIHGTYQEHIEEDNKHKSSIAAFTSKPVVLDHHLFDTKRGWMRAESMSHPTLRLRVEVDKQDYDKMGTRFPNILPSYVNTVTDTGAQSCLWGVKDFYRCGFKDTDLVPVTRTIVAANREEITVLGAILLRLRGTDSRGKPHTAAVMVYVTPDTERFYLSRSALIQLGVISRDFPRVGAVMESCPLEDDRADCGCLKRELPPSRPGKLPFSCCPENIDKMKKWLHDRYRASTFNDCPHQKLSSITGPELQFHLKPDAKFSIAHIPSSIPLHLQEDVKNLLDKNEALGVLEKVPYGEPSKCCHRLVATRKANGDARLTVDMSSLNEHCLRETHHVKPPFQQAKAIPRNTWKSVTDARDGYHSVPLRVEDRYLTTFITPWGRYRYCVAPQGSTISGDAYARRYDEVIADFERKTKCVDDAALWDDDIEQHWWRMIDFIEHVGKNGVSLNFKKLQFSQREIDFAGFHITETTVRPMDKFLKAIADFPTPKKTTDIRAWFGLVNHVSHYNRLIELVEPFRMFLGKNKKFEWNDDLEKTFQESKAAIIDAIKEGVEIFDLNRPTCLQTDFSEIGIGHFMSQKHCQCPGSTPGCCEQGWHITLAGSRFLKPAETRYSPVEGEALAIAWSLEQTRYFTLGCKDLSIVTDHKPLLGFFRNTALDDIANPRLFALKQKTLPWTFKTFHSAGKDNKFPDAASRFPSHSTPDETSLPLSEVLCNILGDDDADELSVAAASEVESVRAITWERVRSETEQDTTMLQLIAMINSTFPPNRSEMPPNTVDYWSIRDNLYTVDGVIMMKEHVVLPPSLRNIAMEESATGASARIIIPTALRSEVIRTLHSAHQGVSAMTERAKASVYWPGITTDIRKVRQSCNSCNRNMPSQAKTPPSEPCIPTSPFEAIAADYFDYMGSHYFVSADRLSGWVEMTQIKVGTNEAGATGLCTALRRMMVTFGVPVEISSDGGPEFIAGETKAFLERWGIRHRQSSAYHPSSNGRAELAVKTAKRLIMDNVGADGKLDNDRMVRALLTHRNTPDVGCKLSPAQILLGRPLRDTLPFLQKDVMCFNNPQVLPQWRESWKLKENALRERYVKTLENLGEHSRPLPPLRHGDKVMVQNQRGRHPTKWDHSGTVVETKPNDQYTVKISGSGRLTLRNRKFLRSYESHDLHQSVPDKKKPDNSPPTLVPPRDVPTIRTTTHALPSPPSDQIDDTTAPRCIPQHSTPATPTRTQELRESRTRLSFGSVTPASTELELPPQSLPTPPAVSFSPRRSARDRVARRTYNASTGEDMKPTSVPEEV